MKRITLFLLGIVLMSTVACGRTNSNANSDRVTAAEDSKAKVIHLTKAEFLEKVYNFEKIPMNGNMKVTNLQLSISMLLGAVHVNGSSYFGRACKRV